MSNSDFDRFEVNTPRRFSGAMTFAEEQHEKRRLAAGLEPNGGVGGFIGATFDGNTQKFGTTFEVHSTGAMRSTDANEVRFDLIPQRMLERVAKVMKTGAHKYGEYNWQKGFTWSSLINHISRHLYLYLIGDKNEDHLAHMVCNLGFLIEFETTHPELNDIPSRQEKIAELEDIQKKIVEEESGL